MYSTNTALRPPRLIRLKDELEDGVATDIALAYMIAAEL